MLQSSGRRSAGRLIVQFKATAFRSAEMLEQKCRSLLQVIPKGVLVRPPGRTGRAVFSVDPDADLREIARQISSREDVEYAEPDATDSEAG